MSQQSWTGEWDTFNFTYSSTKYVSYPSVSQTAASTSVDATTSLEVVTDEAPTVHAPGRSAVTLPAPAGAPFQVVRDDSGVFVDPDVGIGLAPFRSKMHALGLERLARGGGIEAVLTFSRPLTPQELAELASLGAGIQTIEAIGIDGNGDRASAGAPFEENAWDELSAFAMDAGIVLEGVVSATATIPDQRAFSALVNDSKVYLVDASPQLAMDSAQLARAPSVNDVYWYLAGWEPVD